MIAIVGGYYDGKLSSCCELFYIDSKKFKR